MKSLNQTKQALLAAAHPARVRAVLLRGVLALVALAAVAYLPYSLTSQSEIERLQLEVQGRIDLISTTIFGPTDKYSYLPSIVADYRVINETLAQKSDPQRVLTANVLLDRINTAAGSSVIYLLDMNGLVIASSNWNARDSFVGSNYAFRPYFTDALKKGAGRFYAQGVTTKLPGYFISTLVKSKGVPVGVVVAKVNMVSPTANWRVAETAVVTDEKGVIFLSSNKGWRFRPLWPLSAQAAAAVKSTRQYDDVLKSPLGLEVKQVLGPGERIVRLAEPGDASNAAGRLYFMKSQRVTDSSWGVTVFIPIDTVAVQAQRVAVIALSIAGFFVLLVLYVRQVRSRVREQDAARHRLECTHAELARQHGELQHLSEQLHVKSITDDLTAVYNRRHFMEAVLKLASAAVRHELPLSVLMIDVDHFKRINDTHGHPAGDKVLQALAAILREEMREADLLARYGGEEFIVALPHTAAREAEQVAERIRLRLMGCSVNSGAERLAVTVSVGVSQHLPGEPNIELAIKRADDALYLAKDAGRNRVMVELNGRK